MSLVSIALLGKRGEPLYVQEFHSASTADDADVDGPGEDVDFFGFHDGAAVDAGENDGAGLGGGLIKPFDCSLRHQFVLHAAMDRFEEVTAPGVRQPHAAGSSPSDAMWLGLLCPVEELRVYGYLTTTKIKILAAVEDSFLPEEAQRQKSREGDIKNLFANIHTLYIEHTLNPFAAVSRETRIDSPRFHDGVRRLVGAFNGSGTAIA